MVLVRRDVRIKMIIFNYFIVRIPVFDKAGNYFVGIDIEVGFIICHLFFMPLFDIVYKTPVIDQE